MKINFISYGKEKTTPNKLPILGYSHSYNKHCLIYTKQGYTKKIATSIRFFITLFRKMYIISIRYNEQPETEDLLKKALIKNKGK